VNRRKLTNHDIRHIRRLVMLRRKLANKRLAERFGVSVSLIAAAAWGHIRYE
jgi:DNA-binding transcriptional regulator YiaG